MFAPAVPQLMANFHLHSDFLQTLVVSIYVLGQAVGPLIAAPVSELHGRRPVYLASAVLFLGFTVGCALSPSLPSLVVFRFLAGCAGATPTTIGGATIADIYPADARAGAMAVWGMGVQLGPTIGPLVGGFLSEKMGWRWVFWLQAIVIGALTLLSAALLPETYPGIRFKRTGHPAAAHLRQSLVRPVRLLFTSQAVAFLGIYTAVIFGYFYLFLSTLPVVFQGRYHFGIGTSGLAYLGLGVGAFIGLVLCGKVGGAVFDRLKAKNDNIAKPKYRLPLLIATSPLSATSLFIYGWSVHNGCAWIVPLIATAMFSTSMMPAFVSSTNAARKYSISRRVF